MEDRQGSRIVKLQYREYEPGEFIDISPRNYEQTEDLIRHFSWEAQRPGLVVTLTNPSVTMDGPRGDHLKLALFYNGRYVLHYLDSDGHLYTKSFAGWADSLPEIREFFDKDDYTPTALRQETTWFQRNEKHFATGNFRYEITPDRIWRFTWSTSGFHILLLLGVLTAMLVNGVGKMGFWGTFLLSVLLAVQGGILNALLILQYYLHSRDKVLIMTRGNDLFQYGEGDTLVSYNKKDIDHVHQLGNNSPRNPLSGIHVMELYFKDGRFISIPTLLIDQDALLDKLYMCPVKVTSGIPFVKMTDNQLQADA